MTVPTRIGKYRIVRLLGQGGMGSVYLGHDAVLNRHVAIKVLREGAPPEHCARFRLELSRAAQLRHPNIVAVWDSGVHKGQLFMVMEYIDGHTLAALIERREPLSLNRKLHVIDSVCLALAHVHQAAFVHRDVKPSNIMVDRSDWVKVVDFGIARAPGSDLTGEGAVIGTMSYMAPEQVTGGPVDSRADIFATGLVLYELLSYRRAFGDTHDPAVHRLLREAPLPLMTLCPDLPVAVADIVNKALEKDPNRRYQDIGDMRSAIAAVRARLQSAAAVSTRVAMPDVITRPRAVPARDPRRASSGPGMTAYSRRLPAVGGAFVLTAALSQLWLAPAYEGRLPDLPASPAAPQTSFVLPPPPATPFAAPVPKAPRLEPEANEHSGLTIRPASSEAQATSVAITDTPAPRIAEPAATSSDRSDAPIDVQARPPLQTTSRLPATSVGGVRESPSGESASRDIRELLEGRYAGAMTDRRVEVISAIYPAVDRSLLQRQFAAVRSWRVAMSCPVVNVGSGADSADATCAVTYQTELAARPGQRETSDQTAHVRLTRRLDSWSIDRVRFGR